ncbi:MAG: reprolysin-like metallopeptidase [Pseudomonadota bacterium]
MTTVYDYTALLSDRRHNEDMPLGTASFVTYTFLDNAEVPSLFEYQPYSNSGYFAFSYIQQVSFRVALSRLEAVAGVKFIEVHDPDDASIQVFNTYGSDFGGWANYPFGGNGRLVIDSSGDYAPGTSAFEIILHELGHAVGLKHPFEGTPTLPSSLDNENYTLMSYTGNGANNQYYAPFDVTAMQYLYGRPVGVYGVGYYWEEYSSTFYITGTWTDDNLTGAMTNNYIDGGWGNDRLAGRYGDDIILGGLGNDVLVSSWGNDVLMGGAGHDVFQLETTPGGATYFGDAGADYFLVSSTFHGRIDGGGDFDTVDYSTIAGNIVINMDSGGFTLIGVEQIIGTWFSDWLHGDAQSNTFMGGASGDHIDGKGGFDTVSYANAAVPVVAGLGAWTHTGDAADDILVSIEGVVGSAYADALDGDAGDNFISGGAGDDYIFAAAGNDTVVGEAGNDTLLGGSGDDTLSGGVGYDYLGGGDGLDTASYAAATAGIVVELFVDRVSNDGTAAFDNLASIERISGSWYGDLMYGDGLDNQLLGNGGADAILAGYGNDFIAGGVGSDYLSGSGGGDSFYFSIWDLLANEWDTVADFGQVAGNFDTLAFAGGLTSTDITMFDSGNDVFVSTVALAFTGGIQVLNASMADVADQLVFY